MRLVSCYIAGFGKFVNRSFDLSKDVVVIKEENGWGKTTLAAFIESMLFGLDGGRSKTVSGNDRIKYEPFLGGAFGGALVFTYAGKTYRVERSFGKTAGGDGVKVYDGNNMQCFEFGDKAERLGETVTGLSRESYRKSVYIPQGEPQTAGLPDDMKGRLLAILSADNKRENGAQSAIDRLDAAERALRAKRRPAKGKLDEIDERLSALSREQDECKTAERAAASLRAQEKQYAARLAELSERLGSVSKELLDGARREERQANEQAYRQLRSGAESAQNTLDGLNAFFGGIDPKTVNTDGLQNAVNEFYTLKEELVQTEEQLRACEAQLREAEALTQQLSAVEKTVDSYALLLNANRESAGAGKHSRKEKTRKKRKKRGGTTLALLAFMAAAIFGAAKVSASPTLGYALLAVGGVGLIACLVSVLKGSSRGRGASGFDGRKLGAEYEAARAEAERLSARLAALPDGLEERARTLETALGGKRDRASALETGIKKFLANFRFGEIYDYRVSLQTLRENIARHEKCLREVKDYQNGAFRFQPQAAETAVTDMQTLRAKKTALEREKEDLTAERARLAEARKAQEKRAFEGSDFQAEEERLTEEKTRLENRLGAIRAAREFLIRARENMATRYLLPVEKTCREYMRIMGFAQGGESLRFAADGTPVFDENGGMRGFDYYSTGLKELTDFCMRVALAERMFAAEPPALILDDPFVNLDDEKTERAKRLVRELAKKYQIVYFTCKTERVL